MSTSNHRERPNSPWSVLLIDAAGNSGLRDFTTSIRIAYLPNHHSNTIQGRMHTCSSPPIPGEQRAGSTVGRESGEKTGSQQGGDTSSSTLRERGAGEQGMPKRKEAHARREEISKWREAQGAERAQRRDSRGRHSNTNSVLGEHATLCEQTALSAR